LPSLVARPEDRLRGCLVEPTAPIQPIVNPFTLSQAFGVGDLAAARFSGFFFCLGFLASRLDRFCSLFAIRLLLLAALRRNMPEKPLIQPLK
jgi:hypothetical protein